ncbi:MAG: fibronectin type III domain-containing protein, partial [Lentisphaerae bacterium]|nr:fibronectin type III domain-containing protein [Lentisphaerota bacterium]
MKIFKSLMVLCFLVLLSLSEASALEIRTNFGSASTCNYQTRDIFIVWWDKNWDFRTEASAVLNYLANTRSACLNLNMTDPPGPDDGYYVNIYIHNNGDVFPDWAYGVGTDPDNYPYMTIPGDGMMNNLSGMYHEGFHLYQYRTPAFNYSGDEAWYIESGATWFVHYMEPGNAAEEECAVAVTIQPQLKMWAFVDNQIDHPDPWNFDVLSWTRGLHGYGEHLFLIYLTDVLGLSGEIIGQSYYTANPSFTPQEYFYNELPNWGYDMKEVFADFAAHNVTWDYPHNHDEMVAAEEKWVNDEWNVNDDNRIVREYNNTGTGGWLEVPKDPGPYGYDNYKYYPNAWAYNVYKINNSGNASYTFELDGSTDFNARFRGRIITVDGNSREYHNLAMSNEQDGSKTVSVTSAEEAIYFVVCTVPNRFEGNDFYDYRINITRETGGGTNCTAPVVNVTGTSADSISLSWNATGINSYTVYYNPSNTGWKMAASGSNSTSYVITGLTADTSCQIAVLGECSDGTKPYKIITATTEDEQNSCTAPVVNVTGTSADSISLS